MDTTIRDIDEKIYRALKARAELVGKTVSEIANEAIQAYLGRPDLHGKRGSLSHLTPGEYPQGNERLSENINTIVYSS
jgi:hypothetical protein